MMADDPQKEALRALLTPQEQQEARVEHEGQTIVIRYVKANRGMRNEALEAASIEYQRRYKENGFLPTVFEREMAMRQIKWWNLPISITLGWDMLPPELGDKISEAIGISRALSGGGSKSQEFEDAKNSPSPESPAPDTTPA